MAHKIQHKKSSVLNRKPSSEQLDYGEIAINYAKGSEMISFKNSIGDVISFELNKIAKSTSSYGPADSAKKLTTPRTISLNGLINGSVQFDGTQNVSLTNSLQTISWGDSKNCNDYIETGIYHIQGIRNTNDDNLPISTYGEDILISAILIVSETIEDGNYNEKFIGQTLILTNSSNSETKIYNRTLKIIKTNNEYQWGDWTSNNENTNNSELDNVIKENEKITAYALNDLNKRIVNNSSIIENIDNSLSVVSGNVKTISEKTEGAINDIGVLQNNIKTISGNVTTNTNNFNSLTSITSNNLTQIMKISGDVATMQSGITANQNNINKLSGDVQTISNNYLSYNVSNNPPLKAPTTNCLHFDINKKILYLGDISTSSWYCISMTKYNLNEEISVSDHTLITSNNDVNNNTITINGTVENNILNV